MIHLNNKNPRKITLVYKSRAKHRKEYRCHGATIFPTQGKCFIVGFGFHHWKKECPTKFLQRAIKKDIGIIYVCDELPKDYIIDDHIVYVITGFEWFTHLLFKNTAVFKGAFHNGTPDGKRYAEFVTKGSLCVPLLDNTNNLDKLDNVISKIEASQKSVLVETFDGLGDVLLSLPAAETLYHQGYKVSYYTNPSFACLFDNLKFIDKVYKHSDTISTASFGRYIILTHKLSEYQREYNQQNRIFSSAYFFNLSPNELVTQKPTIVLSDLEKDYATQLLKPYKNTVGLCWNAHGFSRSYPADYAQRICDELIKKGFIPVILSLNTFQFKGAVNLGGKLNIRQLCALVWKLDNIITVDTGVLHIAGAFEKNIVAIVGPIPGEWRCSTYKNCTVLKPNVSCYPCMDGQFIEVKKRKCLRHEGYCLKTISPEKIVNTLIKTRRK